MLLYCNYCFQWIVSIAADGLGTLSSLCTTYFRAAVTEIHVIFIVAVATATTATTTTTATAATTTAAAAAAAAIAVADNIDDNDPTTP